MTIARVIIANSCYMYDMQYQITENKCTGCGTCLDVCPTEAIKMKDGHAVITVECMDCGACPRVCPEGAIKQVLSTLVAKA
ncbi:MAG: 4Fe-4S dicluster domain-containing protein [Nitrospirota bacterium]